jgi:zinc finger SWIM domain-containing protein 3
MNGIFFQDEEMKLMYESFPEILFVDATYKLNDLRMPLYVFLVEDGNGESEIVAVWMIVIEDTTSICQMAEIFKKHNLNWEKTSTIMSDKDFIERDALKSQFPEASILICLFHVLRTFRREITCEKLGITSAERVLALEIVQRMAYAKTNDEYMDLHQELKETNLVSVMDYFNTNWHPIREQWVDVLKNDVTFMNRTNNRIECINQKLKSVITKYSNLPQFFSQLLVTLQSLRTERDHRALTIFQKVPVAPFKAETPEYQYMNLLTPYALNYVVRQLDLIKKVKILSHDESCVYSVNSSEGLLCVTVNKCSCTFRKSMQLPCRHILAVRSVSELDLYCAELCACRWTLAYYHSNHRVLAESTSDFDSSLTINEHAVRTKPILSQHDKYRKAFRITQKLTSIVSEAPMREFEEKLESLKRIVHMWETGSQVILQDAAEITSINCGSCVL